jgi:hypothetical protein
MLELRYAITHNLQCGADDESSIEENEVSLVRFFIFIQLPIFMDPLIEINHNVHH